jgi:uncharacterized protein
MRRRAGNAVGHFGSGIFCDTSGVSIVTGSTSVITVPVMFQFGIDARVAVATNMFALTFMSIGGSLPFLQIDTVKKRRLPLLIVLTLLGSAIGAMLLLIIPSKVVPVIVSTAIIGLAVFSMAYRRSGVDLSLLLRSRSLEKAGYALTFLLGIYGGLDIVADLGLCHGGAHLLIGLGHRVAAKVNYPFTH